MMSGLNYRVLFLLIVSLYLTGCVHTIRLEEASYEFANVEFMEGKQVVTLHDGLKVRTTGAQIEADSLVWHSVVEDTTLLNKIALSNVAHIDVISRGQGALQGFALLGLAGVTMGALIGASSYEECVPEGWFDCFLSPSSKTEAASWGALGGGVIGVVLGPLAGALSGSRDRYIVNTSAGGVDGIKSLPVLDAEEMIGSIAVGDHVKVTCFKQYWPQHYEGVVRNITRSYLVLDTEKGSARIRRHTIQSIYKMSVDAAS